MCQKRKLHSSSTVAAWCLVVFSFIIVILSMIIILDERVIESYGSGPRNKAIVICCVGCCLMAVAACGIFGSRHQNKFCLFVYILFLAICSLITILTSSAIMEEIAPLYSADFQADCVAQRNNPGDLSAECVAYLTDSKREAMRMMWKQMFLHSLDNENGGEIWLRQLENIQGNGACCGFDPPYGCYFGESTVNSPIYNNATDASPNYCGEQSGWYPVSEKCNIQLSTPGKGTFIAGCPYWLPVGECLSFSYTNGCAYATQLWLIDRVEPLLKVVDTLIALNLGCALLACLLCAKRKDDDVVPTHYVAQTAAVYAAALAEEEAKILK